MFYDTLEIESLNCASSNSNSKERTSILDFDFDFSHFFEGNQKMNARDLANNMQAKGLTILEGTLDSRVRACMEAVKLCIRPVSASDKTCLRNIGRWAGASCESGTYCPEELLARIIDHALEATNPACRNPKAVFMYLMKTELHYAA